MKKTLLYVSFCIVLLFLFFSLTACSKYEPLGSEFKEEMKFNRKIGIIDKKFQSVVSIEALIINGHTIELVGENSSSDESFFINTKDYGPMKIAVQKKGGLFNPYLLVTPDQKEQLKKLGPFKASIDDKGEGVKGEGEDTGIKDNNIIVQIKTPTPTKMVDPTYPDLAFKARISGHVIIEVIIDIYGHVTDSKIISGHPLLNNAALDAVKQWIYQPYTENGVPKSARFTVTVPFVFKGE